MRFKTRIVKRGEETEIKVSVFLSEKELAGVDKIKDDDNVGIDALRTMKREPDSFLCFLRVLVHWVGLWQSRSQFMHHIPGWVAKRKANTARKGRKKR